MAGNEIGDLKFKVDADTAPAAASIEALKAKAESASTGPRTAQDVMKSGFGSAEEMNAYAAEAEKARQATEGMADAAEKGLGEGGVGGKLKAAKKLYGEQVEVVQGLVGKLFAVGAIATTFYNIGKVIGEQIIDKLETAAEKAANFLMTVDKADTKNAIKAIADRVNQLNKEIASTDELYQQFVNSTATRVLTTNLSGLLAKDKQKLIEERRKLEEDLKGLSNKITLDKANAEAKIEADKNAKKAEDEKRASEEKVRNEQQASDSVARLQKKAAYDVMTEEQKIDADAQTARDELIAQHNKMSMEDRLANEQGIADAIEAINRKQYDAFKRLADDRNKHMEEMNKQMEQAAKRVSDAWVSSFRSIREASNSVFNTDQAASMVQFAQQMQVSATMAHANMNRIVVEGVG